MDIERESSKPSIFSILITFVIVAAGIVVLYGIYGFLYGNNPQSSSVKVIQLQVPANTAQANLPRIQNLYEGGDYTVSLWMYLNSYNINRNKRKHVLEIGGANFSTLLIALGAFKNSLLVRTHSRDSDTVVIGGTAKPTTTSTPSTTTTRSPATTTTPTTTSPATTSPATTTTPAFTSPIPGPYADRYSGGLYTPQGFRNMLEYEEGFQNATPGSSDATRQDGSLTTADLDAMFAPLAMDDSLLNSNQICDIPNIDMQKWVNITVVLSGRTIDVYMDGKLVRSCVTRSYYKVDATGVKLKITERGGFDGYINTVSTYNKSLTPSEIYTIYELGPTGKSADIGKTISSLFTGK